MSALHTQASHPQAHLEGISGDLGSADGATAFCAAVDALQKPLDVLVCNAGIFATKVSLPSCGTQQAQWFCLYAVQANAVVLGNNTCA